MFNIRLFDDIQCPSDFPFVGLSPEDPAESAAFPENLMNLTTYLRGPAFFAGSRHHPDDFIGVY